MPPSESGYRDESDSTTSPTHRQWFSDESATTPLVWWRRIVGAFSLVLFGMVVVRFPLQTVAPERTVVIAASGDPIAWYLVDTWVMFGLEVGVIGVALLVASRHIDRARLEVWTVMGIELVRGIVEDMCRLARGSELGGFPALIVTHSRFISTGNLPLRTGKQVGTTP